MTLDSQAQRRFLTAFMLLAVVNGVSVGMGRVLTTLYAMEIQASTAQIGWIGSLEALGKVATTLHAGVLLDRYGARSIYLICSVGPMLLTLLLPLCGHWLAIGLLRGVMALCIPFRMVSMNGAFLQRLTHIGQRKAGWFRGARLIGIGLLGPLLASVFTDNHAYWLGFASVSLCFATMAFYGGDFLPESVAQHGEALGMWRRTRQLLGNPEIAESCLTEMVNSALAAFFATFIILVAVSSTHLSAQQGILLVSLDGLTGMLCLFTLGHLLQAFEPRWIHLLSLAALCTGVALLGTASTLPGLAIGSILMSLGCALMHMLNTLKLSRQPVSKNQVAALYNMVGMLGGFAGAAAGATLTGVLSLQHIFLLWIPLLLATSTYCGLKGARS